MTSELTGPSVRERVAGTLPTAVVIGAQKCGTSALHYYLAHHPGASVSQPKELDFFLTEKNWKRGVRWYAARFDAARPVRVDVSPNYTTYPVHAGVFERMASVLPSLRLVYLVRDPLDRIAAQWAHNYAQGRHDGTLSPLRDPRSTYVARSCYAAQVERVLAHYPTESLLVLDQRELRDDRAVALRRIFTHLGLDPDLTDPAFGALRNRTEMKKIPTPLGRAARRVLPEPVWLRVRDRRFMRMPVPVPDVRSALAPGTVAMLRADAARFTDLTGVDTEHWSIWR